MASKHTAIIHAILVDWTRLNQGTLWHNPQIKGRQGDKYITAGLGVGTADIVGIEYYDGAGMFTPHGLWVSIEVKTFGDWLSKRQLDHLETVLDNGGRYYLGLEMPGCTPAAPVYQLRDVVTVEQLPDIRASWTVLFRGVKNR